MERTHLDALRDFELEFAKKYISANEGPRKLRILDIGAGTGRQSAALARQGHEVVAIDLPDSAYAGQRVFPILDYDGKRIPLNSSSIDLVFSSNVLEHVPELPDLLLETRRVLPTKGYAIHIVPTPAWRLWTILMHYPWGGKRLLELVCGGKRNTSISNEQDVAVGRRSLIHDLYPRRHGCHGNTLHELWLFSSSRWRKAFTSAGFLVVHEENVRLFYTGTSTFGNLLPLKLRHCLSAVLGSACRMYVLRPDSGAIGRDPDQGDT